MTGSSVPALVRRGYHHVKELGRGLGRWPPWPPPPWWPLYFQVVSILGIVVNLVAIPLVLGLALPLGEAAVLAQALHLLPLAQGLLYLGQWPLWLGWQAIRLGAGLPGSAIIVPIPTWPQIGLYFLILLLVFAPRRSLLDLDRGRPGRIGPADFRGLAPG